MVVGPDTRAAIWLSESVTDNKTLFALAEARSYEIVQVYVLREHRGFERDHMRSDLMARAKRSEFGLLLVGSLAHIEARSSRQWHALNVLGLCGVRVVSLAEPWAWDHEVKRPLHGGGGGYPRREISQERMAAFQAAREAAGVSLTPPSRRSSG
ncbi:MAG TPA: hypothetical protein VG476_04560 [Acidimicrobiales bacterium]|nr:hypothetical protein [Acidimicrobiales bacterium]